MPFYSNPVRAGTDFVGSLGDGYTVNIKWFQAYPSLYTNSIMYHIYYSTLKKDVFLEGVKYVSASDALQANIIDLIPGQEYFFAVRPVEYDPTFFNPTTTLPLAYDELRFYPYSILREDISATDTVIPLIDIDGFPSMGVIKVGVELIQYLSTDQTNKNLIVAGNSSPTSATLVDQGGGNFYTRASANIGDGYINSLTLLTGTTPTQTWRIRCAFVQEDGYGNPIPDTGKFVAIGSVSGQLFDGYGNPYFWTANNVIENNTILSFSIADFTPTLRLNDTFIIKVSGTVPGAVGGRGFDHTIALSHTVGGFDGYNTWDPTVRLFAEGESSNFDRIFVCQSRFEYPNFAYTSTDGYCQTLVDLLSTDLTVSDADNVDFPMYDFAGWHRTDPVQLLDGTCVGSYIGGEMGCIDAYGNVNIYRGLSLQDQNTQRQDVLLSVTGRPAVLIKRVQTGIICSCYQASSEYPDDRCGYCYGSKYVLGYEQYFNPRMSDGRIMVRPGPTDEITKMYEAGLESELPLSLWTLTVPTIKTRDVLVLFDLNDNEEFRYEVATVSRNNTILGQEGGQLMKVYRIRKFDPAYQIRVFRDTSDFPSKLNTSIGMGTGLPPHTHEIVINEKTLSVSQINQTTAVSLGHNHQIVNGIVMPVLGHSHVIILPT